MNPPAAPTCPPGVPSPRRRSLLLGAGASVALLDACGGGGSASPLAAAAPAPAPTAAPAPAPAPTSSATTMPTVTTWAARPTAASASGQAIYVTDVGVNGSVWFSNGTAWVLLSPPLTLAHKFSNALMDGSMGANTDVYLDGHTIAAGVLGPASGLRITAAFSFPGSGTGNKAPQIKAYFGVGSYQSSFTGLLDTRDQFTTQKSFLLSVTLQNKNSMAVNQIRPNDYTGGVSSNRFGDAAIDFTQAVTIGLGALNNASSANANDQQMLEWFSIELIA